MNHHHVVLTRFSVYYEDRGTPTLEWFKRRLELLARYTLPSVVAQSAQPDQWLVFCHVGIPAEIRAALENVLSVSESYKVVLMHETYNEPLISRLVGERVPADTAVLITTLLDSDDVVAFDFCRVIQKHVDKVDCFLNFTSGAQMESGRIYHRRDPSNPFLSLVETVVPGQWPRTALVDWHDRVADHGVVLQLRDKPMWVQVVHGGNMANTVHGVRASPQKMAQRFPVDLQLDPVTPVELALAGLRSATQLAWRVVQKPHRIIWALRVLPRPRLRRRL